VLLLLLKWVNEAFGAKVPAVFAYSSTRMLLAAITTLLATIFWGPRVINALYAMKTGQSIRVEDCPLLAELHAKKRETPTMGGVLILGAMLLALLLWMDLASSFTLVLLVTTVWLGTIGGYDDYLKLKHKNSKGLRARDKFALQNVLAACLALYLLWPAATRSVERGSWFAPPVAKEYQAQAAGGTALSTQEYAARYYAPFWKDPVFVLKGAGLFAGFLMVLCVVTGTSNAVNLTDGLDGLASGCLMMSALVLAIVAFLSNNTGIASYLNILYIEDSGEIAVYLSAMIGALLGFLWFNGHPAQVFMGDTGSLALGGILGVSAVLLRRELLLFLVGGIFVAEAVSVMLQVGSYRLRNRKRVFLCAPLHHHFEYKGWPETKVVLRFWIISLILALVGLASLKFQ
jgi:phospho-N-acetylmuramoyl-pentapeptide-transferase